MNDPTHYLTFAAAYIRGCHKESPGFELLDSLLQPSLDTLSEADLQQIYQAGINAQLRLDRFKRTSLLPRVQKVLGALQDIQPANLLDIGTGRGAFLWPLLDRFPYLPVTSIDFSEKRSAQLRAIALGGLERFAAYHMDVTALAFEDNQFDVVTALEVLEHIPNVQQAIQQIVRVARRFVIASVPSKEDTNPEHIHLFSQAMMSELFVNAGVERIKYDYVLNHMIVIANVSHVSA